MQSQACVAGTSYRTCKFEAVKSTLLFRGYQRARCSDALPSVIELNPCIDESFSVNVRFPFLRALYPKHSDNYSGISINLNAALLGHCLRRLIVRRLNTR